MRMYVHTYECMCLCMYVLIYVYMYVCMYVCMYACMHVNVMCKRVSLQSLLGFHSDAVKMKKPVCCILMLLL